MPRQPNYQFERLERERQKAAKKAASDKGKGILGRLMPDEDLTAAINRALPKRDVFPGVIVGAELVGLGPALMDVRVATTPKSREEALTLAREHYAYSNDIVDQGAGTLSVLAAMLKAHDWWFFWWD